MWRIRAHGFVFTRFEDPDGHGWLEVLREADGLVVDHEPIDDPEDDLEDVVERWLRHRLGAEPPPPVRCSRCHYEVWGDHDTPGRPGDQAVEIEATVEIGGVIRFVWTVLCRDCAEDIRHDHRWLPSLSDGDW